MADQEILSLDEPYPDVVIDALRRATKAAIDGLAASQVDLGDVRLLTEGLVALSTSYLSAIEASQADRQTLNERVAELEAAVAALTAPPITDPMPG